MKIYAASPNQDEEKTEIYITTIIIINHKMTFASIFYKKNLIFSNFSQIACSFPCFYPH